MELVYLWVEEYKNIHNQGFNFSPRFHCDFKAVYKKDEDGKDVLDEENSELIICDKKKKECTDNDYIENFFGDNINVTAIVGKNGSGKSSLLEILFDALYGCLGDISRQCISRYIVFYIQNERLYISTNIDNVTLLPERDYILDDHNERLAFPMEFRKVFLGLKVYKNYDFLSDSNRISLSPLQGAFLRHNFYHVPTTSNCNFNKINLFSSKKFYEAIQKKFDYNFYPKKIIINFYLFKLIDNFSDNDKIKKMGDFKDAKDFLKNIILFFIENYKKNGFAFLDKNFLDKEAEQLLQYCVLDIDCSSRLLNEIIETYLNHKDSEEETIIFDISEPQVSIEVSCDKDFPLHGLKVFFELFENLSSPYADFDVLGLLNEKLVSYEKLSSGEKELIVILSLISFSMSETSRDIMLVVDEPFYSLHPFWQKKVLSRLVDLLVSTEKNIHLIITSHSPFLLSDIPKQNIIFLDTDEEGKCVVVDGLKEKKQTFGANIHTLLSDSFFMEDGLMGEFAKGKINEIINFHKQVEDENKRENSNLDGLKTEYKDKKKRFWDVQSIIGEEYLQQIIKNHLVEIEKILLGKDEAKQQEIERTKAYLEQLEND